MSEYKLYKIAAGETDEAKRQAMIQALMAVGGGGLGYLLTRYGLGLKGAGAGIAGAGLGAVAGAGAGAILNSMAREQQEKDLKFKLSQAQAKRNVKRNIKDEMLGAANPVYIGMSEDEGGKAGELSRTLGNVSALLYGGKKGLDVMEGTDMSAEKKADIIKGRWGKTLSKGSAINDLLEEVKDSKGNVIDVKFKPGAERAIKNMLSTGVEKTDKGINEMLDAIADSRVKGAIPNVVSLKRAKVRPLVEAAPALKVPMLNRILRNIPRVGGVYLGGRAIGQGFDAFSAKKGALEFVDEEGKEL